MLQSHRWVGSPFAACLTWVGCRQFLKPLSQQDPSFSSSPRVAFPQKLDDGVNSNLRVLVIIFTALVLMMVWRFLHRLLQVLPLHLQMRKVWSLGRTLPSLCVALFIDPKIPLNIQPVVVLRGLKRQQAAALTNFVECFLLALSFSFFSPSVCAE